MDEGARKEELMPETANAPEAAPPAPFTTRRVVAIVGRPNVGKSAIFNRLARERVAIVHNEHGVTRDRLMREVTWGEERFELIDTGGVHNVDRARLADEIEKGVRGQVDAAIEDSSAVIFVVDLEAGITALDHEVTRMLRTRGRRVFVAANKADSPARDAAALEFESFGFPVFPVSALHDRGFDALMAAVVPALPREENRTLAAPLRVAIVGRPNVGKSSFINKLLRSDRVIVSPVPGTTRDSIEVPFVLGQGAQARHYLLTDTAGIREIRKIDTSVERFSVMRAESSIAGADMVVLVIDAAQGPTAQERKIAAMILAQSKGCMILANKWDLKKGTSEKEFRAEVDYGFPFLKYCPVVLISTLTGYNIKRSIETIDLVGAHLHATLPTGVLNRTLLEASERVQPPMVKNRRLRVFYATQVGTAPVRVRLFVNDPTLVKPAYHDYLVNTLRKRFGLEGAHVKLDFIARRREEKKKFFTPPRKLHSRRT
jgi:GTP-binding protein